MKDVLYMVLKKRNLTFLDSISIICVACGFFVLSCETRGIRIVVNGNPQAVISVHRDASKQLLDSANLFAEYIVIAGPTDLGTEFGIYEFLERHVGVRWLMPGPAGEDVPHLSTITVSRETVRGEPAYFSRQLSRPNGDEFARRNRHHARVAFHHNLLNLFLASKYTKTDPEFFGIWDGKSSLPTQDDDYSSWEPCFHAEGITEEEIKILKNTSKLILKPHLTRWE